MNIWEAINLFWVTLSGNLFVNLVLIAVMIKVFVINDRAGLYD